MDKVILYTTGCPLCEVMEHTLQRRGIEYTTVTDKQLMLNKGYVRVPVIEVYHDDEIETLSFADAMNRYGVKENENN